MGAKIQQILIVNNFYIYESELGVKLVVNHPLDFDCQLPIFKQKVPIGELRPRKQP